MATEEGIEYHRAEFAHQFKAVEDLVTDGLTEENRRRWRLNLAHRCEEVISKTRTPIGYSELVTLGWETRRSLTDALRNRRVPVDWKRRLLCWLGTHEWDHPGGHCVDCGKCDLLFGNHGHPKDARWGARL